MSQPAALDALVAEARAAARSGRADAAALAWEQVLRSAPNHAEALYGVGQRALRTGDARAALDLLLKAEKAAPNEPMIALETALACQRLGDRAGEAAALERALAADPYCYPALLMKAALVERGGDRRAAARIYKNALKISPPDDRISPTLIGLVARARAAIAENVEEFDAFLDRRLGPVRGRHPEAKLDRFEESKNAAIGRTRIFVHEPTMLNVARLPALQYYDDELFPWLPEAEAAADAVTEELIALIESEAKGFRPYIQYPPGAPVNQWADLNFSPKWTGFFFWENGVRNDENCARCPRTAALLERLPLADSPGFAPTSMFSRLVAGAHIPPHTGSTNARLVVHLPLIAPPGCTFRVGNTTREWKRGKAWVFDDSIEHEAKNGSDRTRIILMFDVWNPLLSEAERDLINAFLAAQRDYYDGAKD
jgi:aspartyl/asparaginyl beta-hydroxylase (cupin superfamily)